MDLTHHTIWRPAYDRRDPNPSKNFGIHNMEVTFIVKGPKGAVQWQISTGWFLASSREDVARMNEDFYRKHGYRMSNGKACPWPTDLGYHAKLPAYEGQTRLRDECEWTGGGACYYDGSSLNAILPLEGFLSQGEDYLWPKLEAYYRSVFHNEEWPFAIEAAEARARGEYV